MTDTPIEETQPNTAAAQPDETQPLQPAPTPKRKLGLWIAGALGCLLIIAVLGGLLGYFSGINDRKAAERNALLLAASEQFQLGIVDMQYGNYDFAQQRFNYVFQLDPTYPGLLEKMAELKIITSATSTPAVTPSVTAAPTLDTSGEDGLLNQVKQLVINQDYDGAVLALDTLRKKNPTYKPLELDGLYYHVFLARGIKKINTQGELEGGLYDFAQAKLYGPLTREARDAGEWASLYISAAGYWIVDWEKTITYLSQLYPYIPGLMDNSQYTVAERLRQAYFLYGNDLFDKKNYCQAKSKYEASLQIGANDKVSEALLKASNKCNHEPVINTGKQLTDAVNGVDYSFQISADDVDQDPLTFTLIGGALPEGLTLTPDGIISGIPAVPVIPNTYTFTIQVSDGRGETAEKEFTITVN